MQTQVDEIAGDVFAIRPFTCGVGDDQGRVVALEQADEQRIDKAVMADFHGIAFGALQCVERSIDFDAVDRPRGELQFALVGQANGVEVSPPGRVAPA
ncbi:hypothetical protein D3C76_1199480 [compost metagenome]